MPELSILSAIYSVAWGGCSKTKSVKYSIVGHSHGDHIPENTKITTVGPVDVKRRTHVYVKPGDQEKIVYYRKNKDQKIMLVWPLSFKNMQKFGVPRQRLHTIPILFYDYVSKEFGLYIDDFNLKDLEAIKNLIKGVKNVYGDAFTAILIPAYSGAYAHGADDPKELAKASKELHDFAREYVDYVIALAHPATVGWAEYNLPKNLKTMEKNRKVRD